MGHYKRTYLFKNRVDSVPKARYLVRTTLLSWEYRGDVIEPAVLITSELATNAVVHATDSALIKILCELRQNLLTIGVIDCF